MLTEIICDKFIQEKIVFKNGLNVVLGDEESSNSIGKSTLLLIIDFIFGGKEYITKKNGSVNALGHHEFKYSFKFDDERYYFTRGTENKNSVWICDDLYNKKTELTLDEYLEKLGKLYKLDTNIISLREMIAPFIRVWGKQASELYSKPLNAVDSENYELILGKFFKLYDKYYKYNEYKSKCTSLKKTKERIKYAEKSQVIPQLLKSTYKTAKSDANRLSDEISKLKSELIGNTSTFDSIVSNEILALKSKKDGYTRKRNIAIQHLELIDANLKLKGSIQHYELEQLLDYFPNINIKRLSEIDSFHGEISTILKSALDTRKKQLINELTELNSEISNIEHEISSKLSINEEDIPKYVIDKIQNLTLEKNKSEQVIEYYDIKKDAEDKLKTLTPELNKIVEDNIRDISRLINTTIQNIYSKIYSNSKIPPELTIEEKKYSYTSPTDTGTGSTHASLITFDLAIMKTTKLPLLIHDSLLLKQIENSAYEHIIDCYNIQNKQIFISTDNISKYNSRTQKIINNHSIISLSKDRRLFGIAWDEKKVD